MLRRRYRRILFFFGRILAWMFFCDVILSKIGLRKLSQRGRTKRYISAARGYRTLAVEMGGVLIKVGQFLSARVDMLPAGVTDELSGLQDQVPEEDFDGIRRLAEDELGDELQTSFERFEEHPLASASLGQVHRAVLKPNDALKLDDEKEIREVVVKVQRPGIEKIIEVDMAAFRKVGNWLQRNKEIRKRVDLPALLKEFSSILYQEIDYINEGQNAERFWEIYKTDPAIKVPRVIWSKTTKKVLVLEDVYAIKITSYREIKEAGVDLDDVAQRLFQSYMNQIFEEEFFHADPHPGNLFVIPSGEKSGEWQLGFVDFGMVGNVPASARDGLREMVIAVGTRNPGRLVKAYQMLDFLLPGADLELIEKAESRVFERFWGKSMSELQQIDHRELLSFADEFRDLMYEMPFQVPQDLLLLGRTVAILSGMCLGLDPGFNVWMNIRPYAEDLMKDELTEGWEFWWNELEILFRSLVNLPNRLNGLLSLAENGEFQVRSPHVESHLEEIDKNIQGLTGAVIFGVLFSGGLQLVLAGYNLPGYLLMGSSLIPLILILLR